VQADADGIRGGILIGFDAARAVMLARDGCLLGWLSEERLRNYVLDVARDVQRRFTSWADYAADFRISRNFWQGTTYRRSDVIFDIIIERLLTEAGRPWRRLPWPVPGLEVPRRVRPIDTAAPVWTLERWDS
jgi:hypothetical protein